MCESRINALPYPFGSITESKIRWWGLCVCESIIGPSRKREGVCVNPIIFAHTCLCTSGASLHAVRQAGGIVTQIANRMVGSDYAMTNAPWSFLSESINHMVSDCCRKLPPRAQFTLTTCGPVAMAPVPHGERSSGD